MIIIFSDGTSIIGLERKDITLIELATPPPFVRFYSVLLWHFLGTQPVEAKCQWFESHLLPLKLVLKDSNKITLYAIIDRDRCGHFRDHTQLLDYLRTRLLPICNSSRAYKFIIRLYNKSTPDMIASLLQMPEIKRCSNVNIVFLRRCEEHHYHLPVEEVSNWLERCVDGMEKAAQNQKERYLRITMDSIKNAREMIDHLKMVFYKHFFKNKH